MHKLFECLVVDVQSFIALMVFHVKDWLEERWEEGFGSILYVPFLFFHLIYLKGDIVLVGLREFQDEKADIIHKYTTEEARNLQSYGELPATAKINQTAIDLAMDGGAGEEEDLGVDFDEVLSPLFISSDFHL